MQISYEMASNAHVCQLSQATGMISESFEEATISLYWLKLSCLFSVHFHKFPLYFFPLKKKVTGQIILTRQH